MTVAIDRRMQTLYPDEKADMVLYLNGEKKDIDRLWAALRDERSWDFVVSMDGRIILKPLNPKKGARSVAVVSDDFKKASGKEEDDER